MAVPQAVMWMEIEPIDQWRLAWRVKPWPSPGISTLGPQAIQMLSTDARHRLFPSPSGFRRDRRNADHGRARGCSAICRRVAGRASLPDGALEKAARPLPGRNHRGAGPGALYAARGRPYPVAGRQMPRARPAVHVGAGAGAAACSSPISAPRRMHRAGAQHVLNAEYFQRIDALNYTMFHDDGQHAEGLEEADVVLVGVSRTSKTPTSIYLANRGVKTGNVPLVPNVPLPPRGREADAAAGGRALCQPRAHRADPREPAARSEGASRRRSIYRQDRGRRGGGLFAPALRQAQLAEHRRDAPLDRGNRRRGDEAVGRTPRASDVRIDGT